MDIGSLALLLSVFVLVAIFLARPLLEKRGAVVTKEEQTISSLMAERDRILDALQELDFDHQLGKVPEGDYPAQRALLLKHGAAVLRQIDTLDGGGREAVAERQLAEVLATSQPGSSSESNGRRRPAHQAHPDDEIEALLAARRRIRKEKSAGFCPKCGHPFQRSDRFCANCGTTVT